MFCMQVDVEHKTIGKWWEAKNECDKSLNVSKLEVNETKFSLILLMLQLFCQWR